MKSWWDENDARERNEKPDPALFGLDMDAVRARFADYLDHMARWTGQQAA